MTDAKVCSKCNTSKKLEKFSIQKAGLLGRHSSCKNCQSEYGKKYRFELGMSEIERCRNYKAKHKEKMLEYYSEYRAKNKHLKAKSQASRRASYNKSKISKQFSKEISDVYELAKNLSDHLGEKYHVDHIFPIRGVGETGLHVPWNLVAIPAKLNMSKGNKKPLDARINFDWMKNAFGP